MAPKKPKPSQCPMAPDIAQAKAEREGLASRLEEVSETLTTVEASLKELLTMVRSLPCRRTPAADPDHHHPVAGCPLNGVGE